MLAEPDLVVTIAESRRVVATPRVPSHCNTSGFAVQHHFSCCAHYGHPSRPMGVCDRLLLYGIFLTGSVDNCLALRQPWPWTRLSRLRRPGKQCMHCGSTPAMDHVAGRVDLVALGLSSQGGARASDVARDSRRAAPGGFAVSRRPRWIFRLSCPRGSRHGCSLGADVVRVSAVPV